MSGACQVNIRLSVKSQSEIDIGGSETCNNYILFIFEVVKIGPKTILTLSWNTLKNPMNGNKLDQCWSLKDLKLFPL